MKKKSLYLITSVIIAALAILVIAAAGETLTSKFSVGNDQNSSGTLTNLSLFVVEGNRVVNISIMFQHSNGSIMANTTIHNTSANQTYFATTFDTTTLADGTYNFTFMVVNMSDVGVLSHTTNATVSGDGGTINLTVDNTAPFNVTVFGPLSADAKYKQPLIQGEVVDFNVTTLDGNVQSVNPVMTAQSNGTGIKSVIFQFTNGSNPFNVTATNQSNGWGAAVNISRIGDANPSVVTVFSVDYAGSTNSSVTIDLNIDRVAPTVNLEKNAGSSDFDTLTIDITVDSDSGTCTTTQGSVAGSGASQTITANGLNPDTSYSFEVTCSDELGNRGTTTKSFTTDEQSSSGGSSGSSSSGSSKKSSSSSSDDGATDSGSGSGETTGKETSTGSTASEGGDSGEGSAEGSADTEDGQEVTPGESSGSGKTVVVVLLVLGVLGAAAWFALRKK